MKRFVSTLLIAFLIVPIAWTQNLSVTGHITDVNTGVPIQNHLVIVSVMSGGGNLDFTFITNDAGFYGGDSIPAFSQGQVRAVTFDCAGNEHIQEEYFNPGNYSFVFDFAICGDNVPPEDCENFFWYESMDQITFEFFGEAFPMPADYYFWDFGDGSTGNGQQVSHSYDPNTSGLFTVTLSSFSYDPATGDSCMATSSQEIWVENGGGGDCVADFSYVIDSTPNGAYFVQFTDASIGNPANWTWDFGDGSFSEEQNPEHLYLENGTYLVCLTIMSNSSNCYDTYCEDIIIGNGGGGNDCENFFFYETWDNLTYNFHGEAIPMPADAYFWDFGDGSTGNGQEATHTYGQNTGNFFTVSLTTVSFIPGTNDTCMATSYQDVWVGNGGGGDCVADFNYVIDSTPNGGYFVQFTDESIGNPAHWMWDFGDGSFSEEQNPEHSYFENGTYLVCLTIMSDSANNCYDTFCEEIFIGNGGGGNFCENWFWFEQVGNTGEIAFYGEAFPFANEYIWDFGDGSTGIGQEVDHTYDPNSGDLFMVTLTTITNDSMNETCTAVSMQEVWIYNGGGNNCENWFWYETQDYLTYEFFGESYPMSADYYSWDFGDGTTANGSETEHTFDPANGEIQWVTLMTFSYDPATGDSCVAWSDQEVYVGNGGWNECDNFFWFESYGDFAFDFYGESFPIPADYYSWDFGDGTFGSGQQVTHTFDPSQGNEFIVCLTSYSYDPATGDSCFAVSCQEIMISGQSGNEINGNVYIDNASVDFALVGLFGMGVNGSFIYEFTMTVPGTGFYFFNDVPDGEYYILATLTPQSPEFTEYFPTYYGNALFWFDASLISLGEANNPYDINLLSIENFNAGPGAINGIVTIGNEKGGPAENITVLLMDAGENALTYIQSDNEGLFDFSNLEYGTYKLKIELPGINSEIATVIIDEDMQSMDVSFVLMGNSAYVSINSSNAAVSNISNIYPNPVAGNAKMEINLLKSSEISLSIYNQMGQAVYNSSLSLSVGKQLIELNTAEFTQGVYTINITDENGKTVRKKFVKTK